MIQQARPQNLVGTLWTRAVLNLSPKIMILLCSDEAAAHNKRDFDFSDRFIEIKGDFFVGRPPHV
jgi:hypothetical protein